MNWIKQHWKVLAVIAGVFLTIYLIEKISPTIYYGSLIGSLIALFIFGGPVAWIGIVIVISALLGAKWLDKFLAFIHFPKAKP